MLTLYVKTGCPFCEKVLKFAGDNDVSLNLKNIAEEGVRLELIEKGGEQQVPFLVDEQNGVSMYESDDIVEHLKKNFV
ncbi:MAG: glutaredoxin [Candidatus Vogelbacteria bacterium CG10_big_fil_rev_8_21_14_0_10_45_14]|uniref:Glutaredoxin n=1 Tax=Candidatus Vogelbacteria bacterium CG10_big_fil_rev_8_21_14_0_10_45_14 TaxID=1975042 RepID=A0A2H0RMZ9_9BACT|nr:MAG: glutaredoxin [Candidatus Vogelbacteria bacterium CG10_big_fil_rev_8_21_14_0_10_45_14]